MTETEKMQQLHLLAAQGRKLSPEDASNLKSWYERLDGEESVINQNFPETDMSALRKKIVKTTNQITVVSQEVTDLLKQNEQIRLENQKLRRTLESRLVEKAA